MGFFDKLLSGILSENESNAAQGDQNAAPAAVPDEPQTMELRFGSPTPVPYNTEVCGTSVTLGLRYAGMAKVSAADAETKHGCNAAPQKYRFRVCKRRHRMLREKSKTGWKKNGSINTASGLNTWDWCSYP